MFDVFVSMCVLVYCIHNTKTLGFLCGSFCVFWCLSFILLLFLIYVLNWQGSYDGYLVGTKQ